MISHCAASDDSAYATGRIHRDDDRLFRPGGLELTARAIALAHLGAGAVVLDLGCGAGASVRYLRTLGIDAIGIDCEDRAGRQSGQGTIASAHIAAKAEELPFPQSSVHGVLAECSLSTMEDQDLVLAECARVLEDGGRLMISDLYAGQPDAIGAVRALKNSCVSRMIVRKELEARLRRQGFRVKVWEDHSRALRECAARYIMEHGSLEGLWSCAAEDPADSVERSMRSARAGYFLLIATRNRRKLLNGGENNE